MNDQPKFNDPESKALKDWFRVYYVKWMETCENQRSVSSGDGVKYSQALIPFIPFGVVPALPYTNLLTTFIDAQFSRKSERLRFGLGSPAHMASIIIDPDKEQPYILVEWVYGGVVQSSMMFKNKTEKEYQDELKDPKMKFDDPTIYYTKSVTTPFLLKLYGLHQQWLVHGDHAQYLIEFIFTLAKAMEEGEAKIEPKIPLLENLDKIRGQIQLGDIDVQKIVKEYSGLIPNLIIECRGGEVPIDLGGKYTIVISEDALLRLLDGFKLHDNLADLTSYLLAFVGRGLRTGQIKLAGWRWLSKLSAWWFKHRVRTLPKKVQLLAKIMANPFRLLVIASGKGVILTMKNGLPASIVKADLEPKNKQVAKPVEQPKPEEKKKDAAPELKDLWLNACKNHQFIHLAIALKESPRAKYYAIRPLVDLSFFQQIDFYPNNDFVRFILRKGPLHLICNVILPFLSA